MKRRTTPVRRAARSRKPAPAEVVPTDAEARFIEEAAGIYEQMGLPRMAGRIVGWLLICDPPEQTQASVAQVLHASKGSISTMVRMLGDFGMLERVTVPGDRREYLRTSIEGLEGTSEKKMQGIAIYRGLMDRGLAVLAGQPKARRARLEELRAFYLFLEREMPALMDRWRAERAKR